MGTLRERNRRVLRALEKREVLVNVLSLAFAFGAVGAAILLRNPYIAAFWAVTIVLVFIWSVLTRTNDELRRDFAGYPGPFGSPVALVASNLPGAGPKAFLILLVVGTFAIALLVIGSQGTPTSVAMANAACADAFEQFAGPDGALRQFGPFEDATQAIRGLKPPSGATQAWRVFVAGLVAHDKALMAADHGTNITLGVRARLDRAIQRGDAAANTLGVRCAFPHV